MVQNVKNESKILKASDGGGLSFVGEPQRLSWCRMDYRSEDKQK